ncbi:MAG: comEA [Marmoricola sp.]|nr:comEA [Marmoricola sp.]
MRRDSAGSTTRAARAAQQRLALLGEELARAGLAPPELPQPAVPPDPGRHSRRRAGSWSARWAEALQGRLPDTLQGRVQLATTHLALLAVAVGIALAVTAWFTLRSAPDAVRVPVAHTSPAAHPPAAPSRTPASVSTAGAPTAASSVVVVDVAGKVPHPGVLTLPAGSRVIDAIRRAGGARRGVDLSGVNLARVLVDGEQVLVGRDPPAGGAPAPGAGSAGAGSAPVNLNSATLDQLEGLPGVGPVTAQKILDWRTAHGSFTSLDELLEVPGIGAKTLANLSPHATL